MTETTPILYWPLFLVAAYLIGSVPFAQVIGRLKGVDLRHAGTGNVGAGNVTRTIGRGWGMVAAVLDGLKGLIPVLIALRIGMGRGAAGMVGVMAVIGHNWSLFLRGRSGRGLAASVGLILPLDPVLLVWTGGWSVAGWKIGAGVAGFLGWGLLPVVAATMGRPVTETLVLLLLSVVLMWRRAQGNPDSTPGLRPAMRRALFDTDEHEDDDYSPTVDHPLTP